jgi:hypothetical protein
MNKSLSLAALITIACLCLLFPSQATANPIPIIQYQATNLTDTTPGQDLWKYTYTLSYATAEQFLQNQAFAITFDLDLYGSLQDPPPAVSGWETFVFQPNIDPDPAFNFDGEYDARTLVDNPSIANSFSLAFIWLGGTGTTPGSQPFTLYQFAFDTDLNDWIATDTLGSGQTVVANNTVVPEPATSLLLASGLIAGALLTKKRK